MTSLHAAIVADIAFRHARPEYLTCHDCFNPVGMCDCPPAHWCASCDDVTQLDRGMCVTCSTVLDADAHLEACGPADPDPYASDPFAETPGMATYYRSQMS